MADIVCEVSIGLCVACGCQDCAMLGCVYSIDSVRYVTCGHVCGVYAVLLCLCPTCGEKADLEYMFIPPGYRRGEERQLDSGVFHKHHCLRTG